MRYDEFQRHIGKAGLTLSQFAELVKINRVSLSNYGKKGEVPDHWAIVVALMGEMAENAIDFRHVVGKLDLQPKKVRGSATKGKFGGSKQTGLF